MESPISRNLSLVYQTYDRYARNFFHSQHEMREGFSLLVTPPICKDTRKRFLNRKMEIFAKE